MAVEQNHWFKIDRDGNWFHNDAPINRTALVKLFAGKGLKRDNEGYYWMQSPFEKYPVEVEDVPFLIVDFQKVEGGVDLVTNMDEHIELGVENFLQLRVFEPEEVELPYVHVRDGLYARLNRSVFYNLIETFGVEFLSRGKKQVLGKINDEG